MKRLTRIFLLYLENVFQYRSRIFVWFLISVFHPFVYLLFWSGANQDTEQALRITPYYLFFIAAAGFLFVHVEADAYEDFRHGNIATYLLKPFSYLSYKFMSELPWRLIQGVFGLITLLIIWSVRPVLFSQVAGVHQLGPVVLIAALGYLVMFLFKMIILISAVWFTDIGAMTQFAEILIIIGAGFIMPIVFFPSWAQAVVLRTPFPYTVYYPVIAVQGLLTEAQQVRVMGIQIAWIVVLYAAYRYLWSKSKGSLESVGQ